VRPVEGDYQKLLAGWIAGERDRENALQLLFLAWMHWADPPFVTKMSDDPQAPQIWHEVYDFFGGEWSCDAEFLAVAGLMAHLFPYVLGDETVWSATAQRLKARSLALQPDGFPAKLFEGRGDFGEYFAHQSRNISTLD